MNAVCNRIIGLEHWRDLYKVTSLGFTTKAKSETNNYTWVSKFIILPAYASVINVLSSFALYCLLFCSEREKLLKRGVAVYTTFLDKVTEEGRGVLKLSIRGSLSICVIYLQEEWFTDN